MYDETAPVRPGSSTSSERPSASLLVRCWLEPREGAGEAPILRGYVKNLKTGEEQFIKDLDAVGEQIRRQLASKQDGVEISTPTVGEATSHR
jgi:hypothetical protein